MLEGVVVSDGLVGEPLLESLGRFREEGSLSESNGYVRDSRTEGSEDAARSRDSSSGSCSIWQKRVKLRGGCE